MSGYVTSFARRISLAFACIAVFAMARPALSAPLVLFSDDFESPTSTATAWFFNGDNNPGTPVVGQPWTIVEPEVYNLQQVRFPQNLVNNATVSWGPPADGGEQYLHMYHYPGVAAWASLSADDQALVASAGKLHLSVEVFGLSGYDGWHGDLRIAGYDSAATVGTSPAFDVELAEASYGVNGVVQYTDGTGSHTAGSLVNQVNVWQTLSIDADFNADTFSLTLDGNTVSGLTWAGTGLSKIQSVVLTLGSTRGADVRGGFDNFSLSLLPEPSSLAMIGLAGGLIVRRKHRN